MRHLLAMLLLMAALTSCAGNDEAGPTSDAAFNDADVTFASEMIPHHAEALSMVDLVTGRDVSPELADLSEGIRAEQSAEIETMVDWLTDWDQPVPETMRDHANAHGGGDQGEAHGTHSADELAELEALSGSRFEERWLEMMIEHHEHAVEMAGTEVDEGQADGPVRLAEQISRRQRAEIERMERMLGSSR